VFTSTAVVPIGNSARLSEQLVKARPMQVYPSGAHGLTATDKERFNADLLAFLGVSTVNPTRFSWQILGQRGKDRATEPVHGSSLSVRGGACPCAAGQPRGRLPTPPPPWQPGILSELTQLADTT
jgi:hypothetical protein